MSYAVSKPAHDLSTAKFVACFSISFSHLFFRVFFAWCKIECKYLMFGWLLDLHLHTNTSLDVSEESEMDLWSDRFGSWIGRSSKSKSPDSMKHLRYDRKSSSGYLIGSRISCWCWFLHYLFARTLHTPNTLSFPQNCIILWMFLFVMSRQFVALGLGGVSSASPDFFEATGRRSSSGKVW